MMMAHTVKPSALLTCGHSRADNISGDPARNVGS